jgi:hypothetical protein
MMSPELCDSNFFNHYNLREMRLIQQFTLVVLVAILFSSCAKIFYSPDAYILAHSQKIIAIIPPTVSIAAKKKFDAEAMKEQQKTESINFQNEMYSWMLKRKMQGKISQEIQEIETTNAKLKKAGYPENPLTTVELFEVLGVDGIMTSNYGLSKPMTEGAAIAEAILDNSRSSTNEVHASLSIFDFSNKKLIWNYDYKSSGSLGSSSSKLVDDIMKEASLKLPYMN